VRRLLATVALVACSGNKPVSNPQAEEELHLQPPDAVVLDSLISSNVISIMRTKPEYFMPLRYLQPVLGPSKNPCWAALEAKLVAGYQLQVPKVDGNGQSAYWILEGDLPRAEVVKCVPAAITMFAVTAASDGDLLAITGPDGAATFATWKSPFVIVGPRDLVNGALHPTPVPRWHELLSGIPPNVPIWWGSGDGLFQSLFGVATKHYEVAFERLETAPNPYFAGRAVATYGSAGDAAIVARRIKQGEVELPFAAPEVADSVKRFKVKQTGAVVEIKFDLGMFGGISADTLADITAKLMAAQRER
jgi:hypothetical protein